MVIDDAVFEAVMFAHSLELNQQAIAQIPCSDADGIEGLNQGKRLLKQIIRDSEVETHFLEIDLEKTVFVDIANEIRRDFAQFARDSGETELIQQMLLQGDRFDNGIDHKLVLF